MPRTSEVTQPPPRRVPSILLTLSSSNSSTRGQVGHAGQGHPGGYFQQSSLFVVQWLPGRHCHPSCVVTPPIAPLMRIAAGSATTTGGLGRVFVYTIFNIRLWGISDYLYRHTMDVNGCWQPHAGIAGLGDGVGPAGYSHRRWRRESGGLAGHIMDRRWCPGPAVDTPRPWAFA